VVFRDAADCFDSPTQVVPILFHFHSTVIGSAFLFYKLRVHALAGWHVNAADWGSQYTIDNWGNLSQKAPCNNTMGCPTRTSGEGFSAAMNASNQLNTYSYDATGNMLNDQLGHTFSYDAENRPLCLAKMISAPVWVHFLARCHDEIVSRKAPASISCWAKQEFRIKNDPSRQAGPRAWR
jgi:hypothetical protein